MFKFIEIVHFWYIDTTIWDIFENLEETCKFEAFWQEKCNRCQEK